MGLPRFKLKLIDSEGNKAEGFSKIAFVEDPAIEQMGIYLSKNQKVSLEINEKQQVVAPLLFPEQIIYRNDERGEYEIYIPKEAITELRKDFKKKDGLNKLNLFKNTHSDKETAPAFVLEEWKVESEDDKAYIEFGFSKDDIPLGTWMVKSQIIDKDFWLSEIKDNKRYAYSIEAFMNFDLVEEDMNLSKDNNTDIIEKNKNDKMEDNKKISLNGKEYDKETLEAILLEKEKEEKEKEKEAETETDEKDKEVKAKEDGEEEDKEVKAKEDGEDSEEDKEEDKEVKAKEDGEDGEDSEDSEEDKEEDKEDVKTYIDDKLEEVYEKIGELQTIIDESKGEKEGEGVEMSSDKPLKPWQVIGNHLNKKKK